MKPTYFTREEIAEIYKNRNRRDRRKHKWARSHVKGWHWRGLDKEPEIIEILEYYRELEPPPYTVGHISIGHADIWIGSPWSEPQDLIRYLQTWSFRPSAERIADWENLELLEWELELLIANEKPTQRSKSAAQYLKPKGKAKRGKQRKSKKRTAKHKVPGKRGIRRRAGNKAKKKAPRSSKRNG